MKRWIGWIEKVWGELNNAFLRKLLDVLIEAYNRIDTSLVKNQLMMPIWFSTEPAIPFMAKIEKSWNILCQRYLFPKWKLSKQDWAATAMEYKYQLLRLYMSHIFLNYKETTLFSFEGPYIHTIIEHLGMSRKGCTHMYTLLGKYDNKLESKVGGKMVWKFRNWYPRKVCEKVNHNFE